METLFDKDGHRNILLDDFVSDLAVQANHHIIVHGEKAMLLDPGGHKAFRSAMAQLSSHIRIGNLQYIFMSHQDPDVVAAINGWLMTTDAEAWCPQVWIRFVPHFGLDRLVEHRLKPIPDEGMVLNLNGCELLLIPAHFLHSVGNFHVYDPASKILYSGDLGASVGMDYHLVEDFEAHIPFMQKFHERYMATNLAMRRWAKVARTLDIDIIAPQHGAAIKEADIIQTQEATTKDVVSITVFAIFKKGAAANQATHPTILANVFCSVV